MKLLIFYAVKCNLKKLTTRSTFKSFLCGHSTCSWTPEHCSSFALSQHSPWTLAFFLSVETLLWGCFPSPVPLPLLTVLTVTCAQFFSLPCGGSRLGCQDLPAMGAVCIQELAAKSGSSWMSQEPNLHCARNLLMYLSIPNGWTQFSYYIFSFFSLTYNRNFVLKMRR